MVAPSALSLSVNWRETLAVIAVAALMMSVLRAMDAEGAFPGRNGRIAVVTSWLGCSEATGVASISPDGTRPRAVTGCGSWDSAQWFPNGRRLLAVNAGVPWTMAADGTHRRRVTVDHPAWFPGPAVFAGASV